MTPRVFKSGLRAGLGGLIASLIFLALAVWAYTDLPQQGKIFDYLLVGWIAISLGPIIFCIPAITKRVEIDHGNSGLRMVERGLFKKTENIAPVGSAISFKLRVFVSSVSGSRVDVSGVVVTQLGKGLAQSDLEKLHGFLTNLCEQGVVPNP